MKLLGTFRSTIPEQILTTPNKPSSQNRVINADMVSNEISKLCTKVETDVSQGYFAKTLEGLIARHKRKESFHVLLAAMFLVISSQKDEGQRKISARDRKKVIDAFDERFSSKELGEWINIVETDLEEMNWFVENPVVRKPVETSRKRKGQVAEADGDGEPVGKRSRLKNFTGIGNMVCRLFLGNVELLHANMFCRWPLKWRSDRRNRKSLRSGWRLLCLV
jgi:hypothetical protein